MPAFRCSPPVGTGFYLLVSFAGAWLSRLVPTSKDAPSLVRVDYLDGQGVLRRLLPVCVEQGFQVLEVRTLRRAQRPLSRVGDEPAESGADDYDPEERVVSICLELAGKGSISDLSAELSGVDGVLAVGRGDPGAYAD